MALSWAHVASQPMIATTLVVWGMESGALLSGFANTATATDTHCIGLFLLLCCLARGVSSPLHMSSLLGAPWIQVLLLPLHKSAVCPARW